MVGRRSLARVEAQPGPLAALLEVVVAPSPLDGDDALPELLALCFARFADPTG
jgi:hypothetical protein